KQQAGFDAVLHLFDSTISFHAQYQQSRTPQALLEMLVTHPDNPRALAWVAQTLRARLRRIEHLADGATHPLAALQPPTPTDPAALWPTDSATPEALLALLAQYRQSARAVAEGLSSLFFTHSGPAAHSVSV
ncbi:MAG: alpha-E domain-containing protein, partial [Limnohabitans sp.]